MIELLVVLVIITVITTITVPTVDAMTSPKHALRKEGRKIMKLMTEARSAAMKRKVQVELRIDTETREVRMVETRAYQAAGTGDSVFQAVEIDTNIFEKAVSFGEDYALAAFSAGDIQVDGDEEDEGFQSVEYTAESDEESTDVPAVSFTHFGGSSGGGITLIRDEMKLNIAADVLTGRPKVVSLMSESQRSQVQ